MPSPIYLPQVIDSGGYVTQVLLVNPGSSTLSGTVEFHTPNGQSWPVNIDGTVSGIVRDKLEPHGTQVLATQGGTGPATSGYLVLHADDSQRTPIMGAVFKLAQNGVLVTATGVKPAPASTAVRLFVDRTSGHDTGIALVNPNDRAASLRLTALDLEGLAAGPVASTTLSSKSQQALFISQLIAGLPEGFQGTLDVTSDVPVAIMALRSTVSGDRFLLATLPVDVMMEPQPPRVLDIPHQADGAGFISKFFIANLGEALSTPILSFTSPKGTPLRLITR